MRSYFDVQFQKIFLIMTTVTLVTIVIIVTIVITIIIVSRLRHSVCSFKGSNLCLREGSKQRGRSQSRFVVVMMMMVIVIVMVMVIVIVIIINPILDLESGYEETEKGGQGGSGGEPGEARAGVEEVGGGEGEGD